MFGITIRDLYVKTHMKVNNLGCLDVRLKKFTEERNSYLDEINNLKLELQEAKRNNNIQDSSDSFFHECDESMEGASKYYLSQYKISIIILKSLINVSNIFKFFFRRNK